MINLQNPNIPAPVAAIEIDKAIFETQMILDLKIPWLTNNYGRAYRHLDKPGLKLYFPEVYVGGEKKSYHRVTPDNDKKGMCFFVVGKEENKSFEKYSQNFLTWKVGIVFWVNLKLINEPLLENEFFVQNLIADVRNVLTNLVGHLAHDIKIKDVEREFNEIFKEFSLEEKNEYLRAPYSAFRFNCEFTTREDCNLQTLDPSQSLIQNVSTSEILSVILPTLSFSDNDVFAALSQQQKDELTLRLCP